MAEEIIQRLGFDTGDSIANLEALKTALEGVNTAVSSVAASLKSFNSGGNGFGKQLNDISAKVDALTTKINSINNIAPPNLKLNTTDALRQINMLTAAWGKAPKGQAAIDFTTQKTALASFVAQNNISAAQIGQAFGGTLTATTGPMKQFVGMVDKMKTSMAGVLTPTQNASNALTGYITQIGRIALLRAGIAVIGDLQRSLMEGAAAAQAFSIKLAQIKGIGGDEGMGMERIKKTLLETSSEFARPLGETSQAFYQTMQNQIGGATESLYVFNQAAKLATANQIPLNDAVNLVTAAIKGWGLSAYQAGTASGMFFEAIKIGRFEASDLADIIGRIGPAAREMGVSLEESMAAVAIMTQQGTLASTAVTQVAAIMTSLSKPTAGLKKIMADMWGVKNIEQAILKFGGLGGVLQEIEKISGGTSDEMGKLIANIRAMRGAMGVGGASAKDFAAALKSLNAANVGTVEAPGAMILESAGGQQQKAAVELANAWAKVGESILPSLTYLTKFGTLSAQVLDSTALKIVAIGGSIITLGMLIGNAFTVNIVQSTGLVVSQFALIKGAILSTTAAFLASPLFWLVAVPAAAIFVAGWLGAFDTVAERASKLDDYITKRSQELSKGMIEQIAQETKANDEANKERIGKIVDALTEGVKATASERENVYRENAAIVKSYNSRAESILKTQQSMTDKVISIEQEAATKIMAIQEKIASERAARDDKAFNIRNKSFDRPAFTANQDKQRAEDLYRQGIRQMQSARTPEDEARANAYFERSQKFQDKAIAGYEKEGASKSYIRRLEEEGLRIEDAKINLHEKVANAVKQEADSAPAMLQTLLEQGIVYQENLKIVKEGLSLTNKDGTKKTDQQREADKTRLAQAKKDLAAIASAPSFASDFLGLNKIKDRGLEQLNALMTAIPTMEIKVKLEEESLRQLYEALPNRAKELGVDQLNPLGDLSGQATKLNQDLTAVNAEINKVRANSVQIQNELKAAGEKLPEAPSKYKLSQTNTIFGNTKVSDFYTKARDAAEAMTKLEIGTEEYRAKAAELDVQLRKLTMTFDQMDVETKVNGAMNYLTGTVINPTDLVALQKINELSTKAAPGASERAVLEGKKKELLDKLKPIEGVAQTVKTSLEAWKAPITDTATVALPSVNTALRNIVPDTDAVYNAMVRVRDVAIQTAAAMAGAMFNGNGGGGNGGGWLTGTDSGASSSQSNGGIIHRAAGGFVPRGTDTIAAMLSPEEFITKASATRKFFPQLQAMNAGINPNFKAQGGSVTNVGDVNVSVNGGNTAAKTIREIGIGLRRELARGTLKLK